MKDEEIIRCCNYQLSNNKILFDSNIKYSFCEKCGSILLKSPRGEIFYTVKSKHKKRPIEFSPIEIIKSMKKKTEEDYPFLNEEFNLSNNEKDEKENVFNSINIYLKQRNFILSCLQKLMNLMDFSDLIFYQCLFLIDTYLSHKITENMSEQIILYYLVGYFLIAAKSKENEIYEPNLDSFCRIKKNIYLSVEKVGYYETLCLKIINYNVFSYSAYEWISELSYIGFVLDCEINKENEIILVNGHRHSIINAIYKYCIKLLLNLTIKNIFIKYSPLYIAFSLIHISREKFLDNNCINNNLYNSLINLYGIDFEDYKKCYEEIKKEIEEKNDTVIEVCNRKSINKNNNKYDSRIDLNNNKKNLIKTTESIKMKSSLQLINIKEKLIKSKIEDNENNILNNNGNQIKIINGINDNEKGLNNNENTINSIENSLNDNENIDSDDYKDNNHSNLNENDNDINMNNNILNKENIDIKSNINTDVKNKTISEIIFKGDENNNDIIINNNSIKNEEDNKNSLKKKDKEDSIDGNIIVYDENNEEKNGEIKIPKLYLLENNNTPLIKSQNRLKKNYKTVINNNDKNHLTIDCNKKTNIFKSQTNLPNIYTNIFEYSYLKQRKTNNSEHKDKTHNNFLKTNRKSLNQVKLNNSIYLNSEEKKKYILKNANSTKKRNPIKQEKLNSVKKSLFFDNTNTNKKRDSNNIFNINNFKLSDFNPNSTLNNENFRNKNLNNIYKTKGNKSITKKEIKSYQLYKLHISNKRNQSNKQIKRDNFKNKFIKNLEIGNMFNIKRKNK